MRTFDSGGVGPAGEPDGVYHVAYLTPNSAELLMAHFAVPLSGGVLVTLNTQLAPAEIVRILKHSGAEILIGDAPLLQPALKDLSVGRSLRRIVTVPEESGRQVQLAGARLYDELLADGSDESLAFTVPDEDRPISLNYTSGTTGDPKGVVYTHRGAYLNSLGALIHQGLPTDASTCGRCRCSTATGGAPRGRSPPSPGGTSACGRCGRKRCGR